MAEQRSHFEALERLLLRRGVGDLIADRHTCADCGRTPLVGERVHLYEADEAVVCELCSQLRREPSLSSEIVRHSEAGHTVRVRLTARAA